MESGTVSSVHLMSHEFPPFTGGIGTYVEETARACADLGLETTVWAPDYGRDQNDCFPFAVRRVAMRGKQDWLCRMRLAGAVRKAFPDGRIPGTVILAEPGPIRLWMYADLMRLPRPQRLALVLHGSEIPAMAHPVHRRSRFQRLLEAADVVGVVSSAVGDLLRDRFPKLQVNPVRVPGAVRSVWKDLPAVDRPADRPVRRILQVGRITPRKGQGTLAEALARLPDPLKQNLEVRLVGPVGHTRYHRRLISRIRSLEVPLTHEGTLSEEALREAYAWADLAVLPSRPFRKSIEGLGLALLEAAHFGCPVIGSRLGGIPEALEEGLSGLLVPPDDPQALAMAIKELASDPVSAARMGQAGAGFVRASFSWERNARLLCGLETRDGAQGGT